MLSGQQLARRLSPSQGPRTEAGAMAPAPEEGGRQEAPTCARSPGLGGAVRGTVFSWLVLDECSSQAVDPRLALVFRVLLASGQSRRCRKVGLGRKMLGQKALAASLVSGAEPSSVPVPVPVPAGRLEQAGRAALLPLPKGSGQRASERWRGRVRGGGAGDGRCLEKLAGLEARRVWEA